MPDINYEQEERFIAPTPQGILPGIAVRSRMAGFKRVALEFQSMQTFYFDTMDLTILKQKSALRARKIGNSAWRLTLKSRTRTSDGELRDRELNCQIEEQDLQYLLSQKRHPSDFLPDPLLPPDKPFSRIGYLCTDRLALQFAKGGETLELAFDYCRTFTSRIFFILEIENKTASEENFQKFVRRVENSYPIIHSNRSKYLLLAELDWSVKIPEEFSLETGVQEFTRRIAALKRFKKNFLVVAVAGGSASGKTSQVAQKIHEAFPDSLLLSMDDYYRGKAFMQTNGLDNFDDPRALDLDLLAKHLKLLKEGNAINKPIYRFGDGPETTEIVGPMPVIILEGLFALFPQFLEQSDLAVFVETGTWGRMIRRLNRDALHGRTGQTLKEVLQWLLYKVQPSYEKLVEPQKTEAHLIIHNEYDPTKEASQIGQFNLQIKIPAVISEKQLLAAGAHHVATLEQHDRFFSHAQHDPLKTDEILRIRQEKQLADGTYRLTLTYKGPRDKNSGLRPYFDTEINQEDRTAIELEFNCFASLSKRRKSFELDETIIHVDEVTDLGQFVELCLPKDDKPDKLFEIAALLECDASLATTESYLSMLLRKTKTTPT